MWLIKENGGCKIRFSYIIVTVLYTAVELT
nr:MAG TPA: hypothetical protein [Caudoviricetes sp.]